MPTELKETRFHFDPARLPAFALFTGGALFCLIASYTFIRSAAASIFIAELGAGKLPYAMTAELLGMVALIYGYGLLLSAKGARLTALYCCFIACAAFICAYGLSAAGRAGGAAAFFLFVFSEIYIVVLAEQFWSFINSSLNGSQARLLNGPFAGCGSLGALAASLFTQRSVQALGTDSFVIFSAACLAPAALLLRRAYTIAGEPTPTRAEAPGRHGALHLSLIFRRKLLLLLAAVVFTAQLFSTAGNLRFMGLLEAVYPLKDARTEYMAGFWFYTSLFSAFLQFAAVPWLLRRAEPRHVMIFVPLAHAAASVFLILHGGLAAAAAGFMLFKALDYSFFRSAKETFYVPLSYDARYRVKQVIDSFVYRLSKGISSGGMSLAAALSVSLPAVFLPAAGLAAALLWAGCAAALSLAYPVHLPREKAAGTADGGPERKGCP
ncbi:MAG: hypothetical protein HY550_11505 [Elusimicrobia bacterium]|nr:hypothetical protein [Elusimicrobiota bacterium]